MRGMPSLSMGPMSWRHSSTAVQSSWGREAKQNEKTFCQSIGPWGTRNWGLQSLWHSCCFPERAGTRFTFHQNLPLVSLHWSPCHCPALSTTGSWPGPQGWEKKSAPFFLLPSSTQHLHLATGSIFPVTNLFVSSDKQWKWIQIRQEGWSHSSVALKALKTLKIWSNCEQTAV